MFVAGGSEDGEKTKSTRALETAARDVEGNDANGLLDQKRDRLDDDDDGDDHDGNGNDDDGEETTKVPLGFLSPSVREYLELGRSIPGTYGRRDPVMIADSSPLNRPDPQPCKGVHFGCIILIKKSFTNNGYTTNLRIIYVSIQNVKFLFQTCSFVACLFQITCYFVRRFCLRS